MAGTTLKDVAAAAGVSISTASRSLSGNPAISESTRQRVKDTAVKLNYRPNAQARALRSSRSNAIGLVIPSLDNAYFAAMAAAVEEAADKQGLATMITSCGEEPQRLVKALDALMERQVDGIIAVPLEGAEEADREDHQQEEEEDIEYRIGRQLIQRTGSEDTGDEQSEGDVDHHDREAVDDRISEGALLTLRPVHEEAHRHRDDRPDTGGKECH